MTSIAQSRRSGTSAPAPDLRVAALDWAGVATELAAYDCAVAKSMLTPGGAACIRLGGNQQ